MRRTVLLAAMLLPAVAGSFAQTPAAPTVPATPAAPAAPMPPETPAAPASPAAPATPAVPAAPASASSGAGGTWKVIGDVQGTSVVMTCVFAESSRKLTGSCTGADSVTRPLTGEVKEKKVSWHIDSDFGGNPITVIFDGVLDAAGAKMNGGIDVEPMGVGGDFNATRVTPAS